LRAEFLSEQKPFKSLKAAQHALDEWCRYYNTVRPHYSLDMSAPAERFGGAAHAHRGGPVQATDRTGDVWVSRRVCANGVVSVACQQISVGLHRAGARCDVRIDGDVLRFWIGSELVKTAARTSTNAIRKKHASRTRAET
jgi:Integrase core domain